ncbi:MAG: DUF3341 domain-containing protein [Verrucomicrobiota bacterium]
MSTPVSRPHGLLAEFQTAADIFHAALACRDAGFQKWDVYTPFPIHGMDEAMGLKKSAVGWFTFAGGVTGFFTGMSMIWAMNKWDYPLVVGGKPLFTPLFAFPVSYELTILLGAFGTLLGMAFLNRLPRLYNPLFKNTRFQRASNDRFFICIEAADPKYAPEATRAFLLEKCHATAVELVEE